MFEHQTVKSDSDANAHLWHIWLFPCSLGPKERPQNNSQKHPTVWYLLLKTLVDVMQAKWMQTHSALILHLIIILHVTLHWWGSFWKLLCQRHETGFWSSYEGINCYPTTKSIFSPGLHHSLNPFTVKEKVALCLLFASHSKWQLWLSCSNWTLLQIRRANNRPLWWMGRVAVCVVVSSERNRYAISDESHAKSRGYKEL